MEDHVIREELEATLEARKELGPASEQYLAEAFVERIGKELDRRIDERLAQQGAGHPRGGSVLHPGNLALSIPIIAIAGGIGGLPGLIAAFAALAVVFVYAESRR